MPEKTPAVSKDLLDFLERKFPNVIPTDVDMTIEDFRRLQGEQRVLRRLRAMYESQERVALTTTIT